MKECDHRQQEVTQLQFKTPVESRQICVKCKKLIASWNTKSGKVLFDCQTEQNNAELDA